MSKRDYDLFHEYKLSTFFLCVFIFVGCIASYWYFHRRTNSYAHQRENGVDVMAPYYETKESRELDAKRRGGCEAKEGDCSSECKKACGKKEDEECSEDCKKACTEKEGKGESAAEEKSEKAEDHK